ncbi:palindromic element RPE4 domain-containing protein [Rickettsia amblyommatis]
MSRCLITNNKTLLSSRDLIAGSSLFKFFLDTVVKPRYDTERVFRSAQQHY